MFHLYNLGKIKSFDRFHLTASLLKENFFDSSYCLHKVQMPSPAFPKSREPVLKRISNLFAIISHYFNANHTSPFLSKDT